MTARRWLAVGAGAALLLLGGRAIAVALLEHRWYEAMGAGELWRARLLTTLALRAGGALVAGLFAFANLLAVRHSVVSLVLPRRVGNIEIGEEVPGRSLVLSAALLALVLGIVLALPLGGWQSAMLARHGVRFGESDPYFQRDLGFFVYWLPLETTIYQWALVTIAVVLAVVLLLYALTPSLRWERGTLYVSAYVRRHLTVLGGVLLLALAWSYRLGNYRLLLEGSGPAGAFSSIDHQIGIPSELLLSLISIGAALVVLWSGFSGQTRLAFFAVTAVLLAGAARVVAPLLARGDAGSVAREKSYVETRATYSRRAFAVDRVARYDKRLEMASLGDLAVSGSAWDERALAIAVDPTSTEGDSSATTLGWVGDGHELVATVPVPADAGDEGGASWNAARVLASAADAQGDPVRVGGAAETPGSGAGPIVVRPGLDGHALVADASSRVIGVRVPTRAAHLLYGWALQDLGVAAAEADGRRSTLVLHRDVRARVEALVPFLLPGRDVSPIVLGDSLWWALDLYAASRHYPLSQPVSIAGERWWYLHHAAVALVHAQTGRTLVVADSFPDPITSSWQRLFPRLFTPVTAIPPALARKLPPASEELVAQSTTFARYGSRFEGPDTRRLPERDGADARLSGDATPFRLPDGAIALGAPLLDATDRVTGVMLATSGPRRATVWQPLNAPGPRWGDAANRLRAATRAIPAAGQPMVRGPVRAIPVAGGVTLLQSAYMWRVGRPPTLTRVALLYGDSLNSAASLQEVARATVASGRSMPAPDLRVRAQALYDAMRAALRRGDLGAFGAAFDSLGHALGRPVP